MPADCLKPDGVDQPFGRGQGVRVDRDAGPVVVSEYVRLGHELGRVGQAAVEKLPEAGEREEPTVGF